MDQLTPDNFIQAIKFMNVKDRKTILKERLIELILQKADSEIDTSEQHDNFNSRLVELELKYDILKKDSYTNTCEIERVKNIIHPVIEANTNDYTEKIMSLDKQILEMQKHLHGIEQYLRVNNVEIVGLPDATENESNEDVILKALNTLRDIDYDITSSDIDISHPIPSRRSDGKKVSICRFVSRKLKSDILAAKKKEKVFKYNDNDVYINEHLSPEHRRLFGEASSKKKELHYKYIWTNNGITYVRKEDGSPVLTIDSDQALRDNLV